MFEKNSRILNAPYSVDILVYPGKKVSKIHHGLHIHILVPAGHILICKKGLCIYFCSLIVLLMSSASGSNNIA